MTGQSGEIRDASTPLGESPVFMDVLDRVSRLARLDRPCLVVGERGTGKELIAARLHYLSRRWDKPFVTVNCAALSEDLLDSELFGHEAGAFTGARDRRIGRFERADGGTLLLDEIATASSRVQEKILRVVEYGEMERVGGSRTLRVDVRVVGATNVDLPAEVEAGRFRADLLDRLAFEVVTLPPLRARRDDILVLAHHFAVAMARELGRPLFAGFTPDAEAELVGHDWPGNVRELKNAVERAVARGGAEDPVAEIALDPFASPHRLGGIAGKPVPPPERTTAKLKDKVAGYERKLVVDALAASGGNGAAAARALGLGYHRFRRLLAKHGLGQAARAS
ncbi:MAG: phage shock protein operon transcriptional activator [Alphaproteobacteria bacterium]|nr:phage shock protein operon transcriptional activator [Alphaproteobacteria bacterium]